MVITNITSSNVLFYGSDGTLINSISITNIYSNLVTPTTDGYLYIYQPSSKTFNKYDSAGNLVWTSPVLASQPTSIIALPDGSVAFNNTVLDKNGNMTTITMLSNLIYDGTSDHFFSYKIGPSNNITAMWHSLDLTNSASVTLPAMSLASQPISVHAINGLILFRQKSPISSFTLYAVAKDGTFWSSVINTTATAPTNTAVFNTIVMDNQLNTITVVAYAISGVTFTTAYTYVMDANDGTTIQGYTSFSLTSSMGSSTGPITGLALGDGVQAIIYNPTTGIPTLCVYKLVDTRILGVADNDANAGDIVIVDTTKGIHLINKLPGSQSATVAAGSNLPFGSTGAILGHSYLTSGI